MDLDAWINEPIEDTDSDSECENMENLFVKSDRLELGRAERYQPEPTEEEMHKVIFLFVF